jgi:hypothetical protein
MAYVIVILLLVSLSSYCIGPYFVAKCYVLNTTLEA